eukprot:GILJ01010934.1.p1 GENE.GILJ01010934.1~~GILJ01010934.1.p1  ORF type:complete len:649 (-),score=91.00 GILJ01010934.1:60-1964(-)
MEEELEEGEIKEERSAVIDDRTNGNQMDLSSYTRKRTYEPNGVGESKRSRKKRKGDKADGASSQAPIDNSRSDVELKRDNNYKPSLKDVQDLITWCLADGINPKWIFVRNKLLAHHLVIVVCNSLDGHSVETKRSLFPALADIFGKNRCCVMRPPILRDRDECCVYRDLFICRMPKSKDASAKSKPTAVSTTVTTTVSTTTSTTTAPTSTTETITDIQITTSEKPAEKLSFPPLSHYVLTAEELVSHGYPIRSENGLMPSGYRWTGESTTDKTVNATVPNMKPDPVEAGEIPESLEPVPDESESGSIVALDCEMCYTAAGLELTRLTVVDHNHTVLLDMLVKPSNPIIDYNTRFSGITAEMMQNVTTSLTDVQNKLLKIINKDTIVVGHSLDNDFIALKIIHERVVDTTHLYPHPKGLPYKSALRVLASRFLNKQIQGEATGHNPVEDAVTAMELAQLKVLRGPTFGIKSETCEHLSNIMQRHYRTFSLIDRQPLLRRWVSGNMGAFSGDSDQEVLDKAIKESVRNPNLLVVHFRDLQEYYEGCEDPCVTDGSKVDSIFSNMDRSIRQLYDACHSNTVFVVLSGHGNAASYTRLRMAKAAAESTNSAWGETEQQALLEAEGSFTTPLGFFTVKH